MQLTYRSNLLLVNLENNKKKKLANDEIYLNVSIEKPFDSHNPDEDFVS